MVPMVDIHAHILPGIDDGPKEMHESIEMARIAYREGIRTIVCTPHARTGYDDLVAAAHDELSRLRTRLLEENIPVTLLLGFEVLACEPLLQYKHLKNLSFELNGCTYMLLEFDFGKFPICLEEILHRLRLEGIQPIIAHPERYPYLYDNITFLMNLKKSGALLQVNTGSITGDYGQSIQRFAKKIINEGLVSFIATDTHSCRKRGPYIAKAARLLDHWASPAERNLIYNHSVGTGYKDEKMGAYDA